MTNWLIPAFLFVFGAIVGSFLNVCIIRIPDKKSIVFPASHCPSCKTPIAFYDNIPLLSYILLAGRCRHCRTLISFQYFYVELLTPVITIILYLSFGLSPAFALAALFCYVLLIITVIDFQHQIIPNSISIPGIPLFLLSSPFLPWTNLKNSLIGIILGGGILYLIAQAYYLLRREEGMGGGDIKLLAMIGAFLGWRGALISLMIGAFAGTLAGIAMILIRSKNLRYALPFGPFLSLGAFCALLWGDALIYWYTHLGI
jgi:leader peptidase (prepilin peptidase) / N-methyltransferase